MIFNAKWIAYTTGEYKGIDDRYGNPSPYFRRTFTAKPGLRRAALAVAAMGVYKAYLNGESVAEDWLSPGWTDYQRKIPFVEYDVTERIRTHNALGIVLGDGWAVGHVGSSDTFKRCSYCDRIELCASLRLEYEDGSVDLVETDESWKAAQGEIRRSDIYMGEYIDHRMSLGDFSAPDYDDAAWDAAEVPKFKFSRSVYLEKAINPHTVVKHRLTPTLIARRDNKMLYDFGQNMTGVVSCTLNGARDSEVIFRFGEMLEDGWLYTKNLRKAECTDTCILSGERDERFRPLFTFHGFQYMEVTVNGEAVLSDIVGECMYTDLAAAGTFRCSDAVVTKVFENALWGQRDNFLNVPTDCPQRDERLGWTGDSQIFCLSAMYNMDCRVFYDKYLADVRDAQFGNGVIPAVAPVPHVGFYSYTGRDAAAGWSEAIGVIPYYHYLMYGDERIVRENLPALKHLLRYYCAEAPDLLREGGNMYGDWLSVKEETDRGVVANLYFAYAAYLAAELCAVIGDTEEGKYRALYENVKAAFRRAYLDGDGKIFSDTQSAYVLAYSFGIITADEAREHLRRKLAQFDCHLTTGFLGVKYLLPTLCELGLVKEAYTVMTNRDYPGWGYSVVNGATTIWERWNSYTKENGINKAGMNSFNHYSLGSCVEWMYAYCLGIRADWSAPAFRRLILRPYFDTSAKIAWAEGEYICDYGKIAVRWDRGGDGSFTYRAEVPAGMEFAAEFPGMKILDKQTDGATHIWRLEEIV